MATLVRPVRGEAADYYFTYIDQVPDGDVLAALERQADEVGAILRQITGERSLHRYQPGKWTMREVASHINDTERVFAFRAFWFARALGEPLPSFDQDVAVPNAGADEREWGSHIEEFAAVRAASVALFRHMPAEAWSRSGIASGNPFSVSSLAFITVGHVAHHMKILQERYL